MNKRFLLLLMSVLLSSILLLTACQADTSNEDVADKTKSEGKKYAVFIADNTNAFTMSVGETAKSHGESLGHEVTVFDSNYDQNEQVNQIETCIAQGYDGIVVEPISGDGAADVLKQAMDAGIPCVTVIQELLDQSIVNAYVGPDHYEASVIEAEAAIEAIGGKGKVCILRGGLGNPAEQVINNAFHDTIKKYPDIEVVEEQSANWLIDEAITITETWMQKHSDIAAILGESDQMSLGAMKVCQDMGRDDIIIVGRDALPETQEAIRNGTMFASVFQNGPQMGTLAIDALDTIHAGGEVEPVLGTKNVLVTKENVDTFEDE